MTLVPIPLDVDDLVRRYATGESCEDLANAAGVSRETVLRRLKARGVTIRQGPTYRRADSEETRAERASTREREILHAGPREVDFAALLDEQGIEYVQQRAFGRYNVDFALVRTSVAVEVVSGGGNARLAATRRERIEHLLEAGWHVVEVFYRHGSRVFSFRKAAAEYVRALADIVGPEPTSRGKHWMIRADGQPITARRRQVH